ncbi:MAG: M56 family metallopeptidase [bacterium]|nr:M56 family metallopeptidase [bacterium]
MTASTEQLCLVFLATYLAHSTVLIAGAWLAVRHRLVRSLAAREWLWRAALVGGILGATVQTFAGVRPVAGNATLFEARAVAPRVSVAALERAPDVRRLSDDRLPHAQPAPATRLRHLAPGLGLLGLGLWCGVLALRARLALGNRRRLDDGPWRRALDELVRDARLARGVRLSTSARLAAPVAMGVLQPEICVPVRALEADLAYLARPALAHELAHHKRFDPFWLGLTHIVRTLFFFQPLNRLAARELAHLAELAADDWAARRTGDGLALARCLTEVAGWVQSDPPLLGTCPMVRRRGRLAERVHRLLDDPHEDRGRALPARIGAALLLACVPWMLPGWAVASDARAANDRSWANADRMHRSLVLELERIDAHLVALPAHMPVHLRAALEARAQELQTALDQVRPAIRSGLEHDSRPGENR